MRKLDLGDLSSVRAFAAGYLRDHDSLHLLINNAGVMSTPEGKTADGFETQIGFENRKYDGWASYAQSKLANLLHAKQLAKRLEGTGVTAVSVHPGWVRTELMRHTMPASMQSVMRPFMRMIEPWEGTQTTLYAALAPDVEDHPGAYYSQTGTYRDKSKNAGGWPLESPNPQAHDDDLAQRLYEHSRELVGLEAASARQAPQAARPPQV